MADWVKIFDTVDKGHVEVHILFCSTTLKVTLSLVDFLFYRSLMSEPGTLFDDKAELCSLFQ